MNKENVYHTQLSLINETELNEYLKALVIKYGFGNIPIEKAFDFNFKWEFVTTT